LCNGRISTKNKPDFRFVSNLASPVVEASYARASVLEPGHGSRNRQNEAPDA